MRIIRGLCVIQCCDALCIDDSKHNMIVSCSAQFFTLAFPSAFHFAAVADLTASAMAAQVARNIVSKLKVLDTKDRPHLCAFQVPTQEEVGGNVIVNIQVGLSDHMGTKTVQVLPQVTPSVLLVNRTCLFKDDEMRITSYDGSIEMPIPVRTQQPVGKKCPCCGQVARQLANVETMMTQ